jgi:predicted enzyme related to lactoylglutathione lyase
MALYVRPPAAGQLIAPERLLGASAPVISNRGMGPAPTNPIVHLELHTGNLPRACDFYTRTFGWGAERVHVGSRSYLALDLGHGLSGGVVERDAEGSLWLPYVEVPDLAAATERARELGASVIVDCREGPAGWRSVIEAPAGTEVALWQPKPGGR